MSLLIAIADSFSDIFTPIFATTKLAKNAIGIINKFISPKTNFEKKAKKACTKTINVIDGKTNFGSLSRKLFNTVAKSIAPPIPIDALIAPIKANNP